jgi:hypothetical protein
MFNLYTMVKKVQQIDVLWQQGRGEERDIDYRVRIWKDLKVQESNPRNRFRLPM